MGRVRGFLEILNRGREELSREVGIARQHCKIILTLSWSYAENMEFSSSQNKTPQKNN